MVQWLSNGSIFQRHPVNFVSKSLPSFIFLIPSWCLRAIATCLMLVRWQETAGTECVVKIVLNSSNVMCHCQVIDCIGSFNLLKGRNIYSNTENHMRSNGWFGHSHGCSVVDVCISFCHFLAAFILETPGCTSWGPLIILLAMKCWEKLHIECRNWACAVQWELQVWPLRHKSFLLWSRVANRP